MAYTTIPASGAKLKASTLAALIGEVRPLAVRKANNETVNNSATMQDDNELFLSLSTAGAVYHVELRLRFSSGGTPDLKFQFTLPSGTSGLYTAVTIGAGTSVLNTFDDSMTSAQAVEGGSNASVLAFGVLVVGSTTGTATLQWAQNTATASDTSVLAGSYLKLTRLS